MNKNDSILASCTRYLGAAIVLFCGFLTGRFTVDYPKHTEIAGTLDLAHPLATFREHVEPLWHLCLRGIQAVLHCSPQSAGALVSGLALAVSYLIAWHALRRAVRSASALQVTALCLVLHLCAAIYVPWFNEHPYLGQGTPNVWHNPTLIMLRPIALLAFLLTAWQLQKIKDSGYEKSLSPIVGILIAILLVFANLAKPSYAQVFYPAIFLLMLGWLAASKGKAWKHCLQFFFMCLPSVILMAFQLVFTFLRGGAEGQGAGQAGGIMIAPLQAASIHTDSILISTLLALAFPLFMALVTLIRRRFRQREILAWLLLLTGLLEKLLLAETGNRIGDGNFGWGYLTALLIVWFVSIRDYADAFLVAEATVKPDTPTIAVEAAPTVSEAGTSAGEAVGTAAQSVFGSVASAVGAGEGATGAAMKPETAAAAASAEAMPAGTLFEDAANHEDIPAATVPVLEFTEESPVMPDSAAEPAPERTFPVPSEEDVHAAEPVSMTHPVPVSMTEPVPASMTHPVPAEAPMFAEEPAPAETPEPMAETSVTEETAVPADAAETAPAKGGVKDFFIRTFRGIGFAISSVILAAHFASGLFYLVYWLLLKGNKI